MKLLGKNNLVLNPRDLEHVSSVQDLQFAIRAFFMQELKEMNSDTERLLDYEIGSYSALQILGPNLTYKGFILYYTKCSRKKGLEGAKEITV